MTFCVYFIHGPQLLLLQLCSLSAKNPINLSADSAQPDNSVYPVLFVSLLLIDWHLSFQAQNGTCLLSANTWPFLHSYTKSYTVMHISDSDASRRQGKTENGESGQKFKVRISSSVYLSQLTHDWTVEFLLKCQSFVCGFLTWLWHFSSVIRVDFLQKLTISLLCRVEKTSATKLAHQSGVKKLTLIIENKKKYKTVFLLF